jgi:hypothetical protein
VTDFSTTTDRELELLIDHGTTIEIRTQARDELDARRACDSGVVLACREGE